MSRIRGIIFDMDGVLVDAKDWHYEALNRALALFGHSISRSDHLSTFDGLSTRQKLELLSQERGLPRALHGFLNELKQIHTVELIQQRCKPQFRHEFALASLKAEGYKLALASNSIRATVDLMMSKARLAQYFDSILSAENVRKPKPDADIYNSAIAALSLAPEECLAVEDNDHGIQSARAAKAHMMIVRDPTEVTLENIQRRIREIEAGPALGGSA